MDIYIYMCVSVFVVSLSSWRIFGCKVSEDPRYICGEHLWHSPCTVLRWLVVSTPLKNMKVNWDDYSQYMGK